ncbi:hypothetical protein QWY86_12850 [Pedobacter aquatilis]|uniref:hypothetical protein n=1 Tax=Pedobacter aquatilis TaxID=351343 RepID=UPI0025B4FA89|nr:hypothetical protein [Pedobacter aquatilis]MDN3587563.1 hypothetical protein [Pedobacter aquatilis]
MNRLLIFLMLFVMMSTGCKKKFCGVISAISTEVSPADGQPLYKVYLESGEIVPMKSRGGLQVGQSYCND